MNYEIFKNKFLRKTLASWCAFATLATMCGPVFAINGALDSGNAVLTRTSDNVGGSISGTSGNFTMTGNAAVLDWQKLSLANGEALNFNSVGSWYNVVNSAGGMSEIAGAINASGAGNNVYIFNPNGVVFNSGSSVDVGGIFGAFATGVSGTTLDNWIGNPTAVPDAIKSATMSGDITVDGCKFSASQIALAGKNVEVKDSVFNGATTLAAGDKVTIDGFAGATITMTIPDTATEGQIDLLGEFANALVASAAKDVFVEDGTLTVKSGDLTVNAGNSSDVPQPGNFVVDNATVDVQDGELNVTAMGGVDIQGATLVQAKDSIEITANDGLFTLGGMSADKPAELKSTEGAVTVDSAQSVKIQEGGQIEGKTSVSLTAQGVREGAQDITIEGDGASVTSDGTLEMTANKGSITEDADATIIASGDATFTATAGDIALNGTANDFSQGDADKVFNAEAKSVAIVEGASDITLGTVTATKGDVKVVAAGDVAVGKIVAKDGGTGFGNVTISAGKNVTATDSGDEIHGGNVEVYADEGISIKGGAQVTGTSSATAVRLAAVDGAVEIDNATVAATEGEVDVASSHKNVRISNDAKVTAGSVSETEPYVGTETGNINLTAEEGAVSIESGAKVAANGGVVARANDITVTGKNTVLAASDTLQVKAANAVEITDKAVVAGSGKVEVNDAVTVTVDDAQLVAKENLWVADGAVTVRKGAKVASDGTTLLVAKESNLEVASGAQVLAGDALILESSKGDVKVNAALVKAGEFSETTGETAPGDPRGDLRIMATAGAVTIENGAKVGANGDESSDTAVTVAAATDLTIDNATLAAGKAMTLDAAKTVEIKNGAYVGGNSTVTIGGTTAPESLTVQGDGTKLVAKGDLTATAGAASETAVAISISDKAKVASDANTSLTTTKGILEVEGAEVLASENVSLLAERDIALDAATVAGKGNVSLETWDKDIKVSNNTLVKAGDFTVDETTGDITVNKVGNLTVSASDGISIAESKMGASGTATLTARSETTAASGLFVDNAKLVANEAMTLDAALTIEIKNGAYVGGNSTVTIGETRDPVSVTVNGAQVVAKGDLTATAGKIDVKGGAKVASDKNTKLTANTGDITIQSSAQALASESLTLKADVANITVDNATAAGKGGVTVTAAQTFTAKNNAVVKAGEIDEAKQEPVDSRNMSIDALTVKINSGAKVAASGEEKVVAETITVEGADTTLAGRTVVMNTKTAGEGMVTVQNGATVAAYDTLTVGDTTAPETLTVQGAGTKLVAKGNLTATAGKIDVKGGAKVGSDASVAFKGATAVGDATVTAASDITMDGTLTQTAGAIDAKGTLNLKDAATQDAAAKISAAEVALDASGKDISLEGSANAIKKIGGAANDVTVNNAEALELKALKANDVKITAAGAVTQSGAIEAAGTATLKATGDIMLANDNNDFTGAVKADGVNVSLKDKNDLVLDDVTATGNLRLDAGKDVEITADKTVDATQNATVIAGQDVKVDGTLKADKESVYVEAVRDVSLGKDAVVSAGTDAAASDEFGNVLVKAGGNIAGLDSDPSHYGTIKAGNGSTANGAILLDAGGNAGENLTLDASAMAVKAAGDTMLNLSGNATVGLKTDGSITINHKDGTLTVDDMSAALANKKVNKVLADGTLDPNPLKLEEQAADAKGLLAGKAVTVNGTANSSLAVNTSIEAGSVAAADGKVKIDVTDNITVGDATHASAKITGTDSVDIKAGNTFTAQNGAVVKAGDIDESTTPPTAKDAKALTIDAQTIAINTASKVGASGAATLTAKDTTVDAAQLAAGGTMTIDTLTDGEGSVKVQNNATVAAGGELYIGSGNAPATLSVNGAQVVAKETLFANAGTITVESNAKVASDASLTLNAKTGDLTVQSGAKTLADGELYLETETANVTVNNATVAGQGGVTVTAAGDAKVSNSSIVKAGDFTVDESTGDITVTKEGNLVVTAGDGIEIDNSKVGASGTATLTAKGADGVKITTAKLASEKDLTVTAEAGEIAINTGATVASDKSATLTAKTGDVTIQSGAMVLASESLTLKADAANITVEESTIMAEKSIALTAQDSVNIQKDSLVMARGTGLASGEKALTIVATDGSIAIDDTTGENETLVSANGDALLLAGQDIVVKGGENQGSAQLDVAGALGATAQAGKIEIAQATVGAGETMTLSAKGDISVKGLSQVLSGANVMATASEGDVVIEGQSRIEAMSDISAQATKGNVTVSDAGVFANKGVLLMSGEGDVTVKDGASAVGQTAMNLVAKAGDVKVSNASTVKAGDFTVDETTGDITVTKEGNLVVTAGDGIEIDNSKMGASGTAMLTAKGADGVKITTAKLASEKDLTVTAEAGDITIADPTVAGTTVATRGQATFTANNGKVAVTGASQVKAADALAATAKSVEVDGATVASDKALTLTATESTIDITGGALVAARGKLTLDAKTAATVDGATVAGLDAVSVTAGTTFEAKESALVTAGKIDIAGQQPVDKQNMSIDAETVLINSGAKVAASGEEKVVADTITVEGTDTTLAGGTVVMDAKTATGTMTVQGAATVAAYDTLTIGGATAPASLTVDGAQVVAKGNLAATAQTIEIQNNAKVASDKSTTLTTTTGDITVESGAKVLANGAVGMTAKQNIRVENGAEVAAKGQDLSSVAAVYMSTDSGDITIDGSDAGVATVRAGTETDLGSATIWANGKVDIAQGARVEATENVSVKSMADAASTEDNVTVRGENTLVTAGDEVSLYAQNGNVTVKDQATVSGANRASLETQAGDVVITGSAKVEGTAEYAQAVAWEGNVKLLDQSVLTGNRALLSSKYGGEVTLADSTLSSVNETVAEALDGNVTIQGASTVESTAGDVTVSASKNVTVTGTSAIDAAKAVTIESTDAGDITIDTTKNVTADAGDVTAETENGDILVENGTVKSNQKDVRLIAQTANGVTVKGATVEATAGNVFIHADDITIGDAATANDTYVTAGEGVRMESPNGEVDIFSKVTGKNITIVSEKADAGSQVLIDAQYLTDKNILTAEDGSIYVYAQASDIALNNGAVISATDATGTDSSAAGNILLKSETGSVQPTEGKARIVADNGKGVVALVGGGTVGNKDFTIKAGVVVLGATGKGDGAEVPDVAATFEGDTKLAVKASHDVDVDIVDGTLTIVNQADALAGEEVNEVLYDRSVTPSASLEKHAIESYADNTRGAEAGHDIRITGDNANLVVAADSLAIAGHDVTTVIDGDTTINGTVQAGNNAYLTTGGNLATPGFGKIVAGRDLAVVVGTSTPEINIAVGKGVSARSGERAIAFRTVGGDENPKVYGNDSETAVFIDGRVAGGNSTDFSTLQGLEQVVAAGNFSLMPVFTRVANVFPILDATGLQSPYASFTQGYLTSDEGEVSGMDEAGE